MVTLRQRAWHLRAGCSRREPVTPPASSACDMNRCDVVWGPGTPRTTTPKVSGMLEVIGPDDGFILDVCLTMSRQNCLERTHAIKDQKNGQNGRLHVFGPKEEVVIEPVQIMPRQHGCGPESTNKVYTPTKQISLCAAKSTFEKWDTSAKSIKNKNSSRIQETNLRSLNYIQETTEFYTDEQLKIDLHKLHHETTISEAKTDSIRSHWFCKPHFLAAHSSTECLFLFLKFHTLTPTKKLKDNKEKNSRNVETPANNELSTEFQTNSIDDHNIDEQLSETTDDDESSSENEDRKRNAPIELLGEFLKAVMDQDYSLSKKLCQMILIYEPENTEAKQFLPLLEEKLLIESTQNFGDKEGEETDEGSSEDSEEDTSSSDSSDDDGEESSDDSDENV